MQRGRENKGCMKCGKCCISSAKEEKSVLIFPSDIVNLSNYLDISRTEFVKSFCKESMLQMDRMEIKLYMLRFPKHRCIFLTADNLCEVYSHRPKQCKNAPYNFFSSVEVWSDVPCVDIYYLKKCVSKEEDLKSIYELLNGYELEEDKM